MKRTVLVILVLDVLALGILLVSSRDGGNDAAGRGLASAYLLVLGAPVVLAALAWLGGYLRVAGGLSLLLPALLVAMWFERPRGQRPETTADWFSDSRVDELLTAVATGDSTELSPFAGDSALLNTLSIDSSHTVLTYAARRYPGRVGALIDVGADPNLVPPHGLHPVIAALDEPLMVLDQLLERGANPNAELRPGTPALLQALWQRKAEHARLLVAGGANLESVDDLGRTALFAAVDNYLFPVATLILEAGGDPYATTRDGRSVGTLLEQPEWRAWHDAGGFQELVAALARRGFSVTLPEPSDSASTPR